MLKTGEAIAVGALLVFAAGCSGGQSGPATLSVKGSVAPTARMLDNARAVATTRDKKTYWAYIGANGAFKVTVPAGVSYKLRIVNTLPGGRQRVVGHLVSHPSKGATPWITARTPGVLDLGALHVFGSPLAAGGTAKASQTHLLDDMASEGRDHPEQDELDTHSEDDVEATELCTGGKADDERDDELDTDSDRDPGELNDDAADHEDENADDTPACPPAAGPPAPPAPTAGPPAPPPGPGSACVVNADCTGGYSCVASRCQVIPK